MKKIYISLSVPFTALTEFSLLLPNTWRTPIAHPPLFSEIVNMIPLDIKATAKNSQN